VRAVVLTGAGRAFCVGADLVAHAEGPSAAGRGGEVPPDRERYARRAGAVNLLLQTLRLPVVAAVNGHAVGAGLELALSCDLVVVAKGGKLRLPEATLGTFVGGGVTRTLVRRVGETRAREILLLCPFLTGEEAAAIGLANRAAEADDVLPLALQWAAELARRAPAPVALLKEILHAAPGLEAGELIDREVRALLRCMETDDWREGIAAFHEKREPRFEGR
jgi:enoyl-CoA hydratase